MKGITVINLQDVRSFARSIVEDTHDISINKEKYLEILNEKSRYNIENNNAIFDIFEKKHK